LNLTLEHNGNSTISMKGKHPVGKKIRSDQLLFEQGLAESREQAKRLIMAGVVHLQGPEPVRVEKPGQQLPRDARLQVDKPQRFVSRGGEKLLTVLEEFRLDVAGMVCLDAGASTGGFTDCLLQHGAARVYAVDVGANQLHEKLRADPRVISMEQVNLRTAGPELLPEPVDLVAADLSFISLTLVLPPLGRFLKPGGLVAALVKPQFELGPGRAPKGVVRSETDRLEALDKIRNFASETLGWGEIGLVPSRIKGAKGNQEYLVLWQRP